MKYDVQFMCFRFSQWAESHKKHHHQRFKFDCKNTCLDSVSTWCSQEGWALHRNWEYAVTSVKFFSATSLRESKAFKGTGEIKLTKHCDLCRLAVPFSDHVGAHTDVHAGITLSCVGDHEFPSSDLKNNKIIQIHRWYIYSLNTFPQFSPLFLFNVLTFFLVRP